MEKIPLCKSGRNRRDDPDKVYAAEKRRHSRVEVTYPVILEKNIGLFMSGEIKDISEGGAFIKCWEPLPPNEVFQIEFSGAHLDYRMKATAEVVWSNASRPDDGAESRGMGVRFTKISDEVYKVISSLALGNPDT
jgi:hypothetical protein